MLETFSGYSSALWGGLGGLAAGVGLHWLVANRLARASRRRARRSLEEARAEAARGREEAQGEADRECTQWMREFASERGEMEEGLRDLSRILEERQRDFDRRSQEVARRSRVIDERRRALRGLKIRRRRMERDLRRSRREERVVLLERSGVTEEEAKETILGRLREEVRREQDERNLGRLEFLREDLEKTSRRLVCIAIGRCTIRHEDTGITGSFPLPGRDFKERLVGAEEENLRCFEELTGVNLLFDDQDPHVVLLSAFDGMKKAVARRVLEKLVSQNSTIQPARVKEFVDKATREMNRIVLDTGRRVASELRVRGLSPEILGLLGRLNFRTSYGQNVLKHSKEVAFLASTLAAELGIDVKSGKRCGLLHDIGKAVDADQEGGHPEIGANIARRCREPKNVVEAIAYHHEDADKIGTYPLLTQTADAISGSRPGARRETLERYLKHLEQLEEIGQSHNGVETAYAIQAGRELRVFVDPARVDDGRAAEICHAITERVEEELTYPGKIKITVVRESKTAAYAR